MSIFIVLVTVIIVVSWYQMMRQYTKSKRVIFDPWHTVLWGIRSCGCASIGEKIRKEKGLAPTSTQEDRNGKPRLRHAAASHFLFCPISRSLALEIASDDANMMSAGRSLELMVSRYPLEYSRVGVVL